MIENNAGVAVFAESELTRTLSMFCFSEYHFLYQLMGNSVFLRNRVSSLLLSSHMCSTDGDSWNVYL